MRFFVNFTVQDFRSTGHGHTCYLLSQLLFSAINFLLNLSLRCRFNTTRFFFCTIFSFFNNFRCTLLRLTNNLRCLTFGFLDMFFSRFFSQLLFMLATFSSSESIGNRLLRSSSAAISGGQTYFITNHTNTKNAIDCPIRVALMFMLIPRG